MNLNRKRGALYGLAIGDALGAPVEFKQQGTFPPVTCYRSGGPHSLAPGQWTDDTSMALALADSIGKTGWNLDDQMRRYIEWWQEGKYAVNGWCFDIGGTTRDSLSHYMENKDVATASDPSEGASGNGSIMRLAPVAIKYSDVSLRELSTIAEDSSRTTHASDQCRSACRYMAAMLVALINGAEKEEVLDPNWSVVEELNAISPLNSRILEVAYGSYRNKNETIRGSGWVVESLEAALWSFYNTSSFEEAVLKAVNLGNDADTTGAVCGQIAGAYYGVLNIPYQLIHGLARKEMIEEALISVGVVYA